MGNSRRTQSNSFPFLLALSCLTAVLSPAFCTAAPLEIEEAPTPLEERNALSQQLQDRLHAAALFAAGRVLEQQGHDAAALLKYQRAYRYDPTPTVLRDILRLSAALDRYEEAVRYALAAAHKLYVEPELLRPLALVLTQQGEWESALALYEVLLQTFVAKSSGAAASLPNFTELTIRQEATRLYFLTGRFAEGATVCAPIEAALADPEKYKLTAAQQKELLGDASLTYHLFAECHLAAGEFEAAARSFAIAQENQPNAGLAGYNLARLDHKRGRPQSALDHLQAYFTAKLSGEGAAPYKLLGELLTALQQEGKFDERLAQLRISDPDNSSLALFVAQRLLAAEKFEQAEPLFVELAQTTKKRNLDEIYTGLIRCQHKRQQLEPLLQTLGETETKASSTALEEALSSIAAEEALRGRLITLARDRRSPTASKLPPANESWVVAELALTGKDLPTAQEFFEFALQDQPKRRGELLETFGVMLFLADHTDAAAKIFRRGVEDEQLASERTSFQFYLAGALSLLGQTDEALQVARQAAEAAPENPLFATRIAWILQRAKRNDEALAEYLALLTTFAKRYDSSATREALREVRQTVSNLYVQRGDDKLGIEYLEQILDEFPADAGALNDLGYLWAERGIRLERAKQMIEQAVAAEPENRAYLDSLGWVEYQLGNYEAARTALEKALAEEAEPDGVMLEHLGDVYLKLNKPLEARQRWQQAIEALPKDADEARRAELQQKLRND